MRDNAAKIYGDIDQLELPAYEVVEVARYLRVPYFTLYDWLRPVEFESPEGIIKKPINIFHQAMSRISIGITIQTVMYISFEITSLLQFQTGLGNLP